MSTGDRQIECRKCHETISLEADSCPHCGQSVRGTAAPIAVIALGAIISAASVANIGDLWFYLVLGLVLGAIGAALIYEKRGRIQDA